MRSIFHKEKVLLQNQLDDLKIKNKKLEKELENAKKKFSQKLERQRKLLEENAANPIWHKMLQCQNVCSKIRYFEYFSRKDWGGYEQIREKYSTILIGNEQECQDYFERYQDSESIVLNPDNENWGNMQSVIQEQSINNIVVFIMCQDWQNYVGCLELCGVELEHIYVYKLMEYVKNEEEQLRYTWEYFQDMTKNKKIVLVTPNPRMKEFINFLGDEFPVSGILSAKKVEIGTEYLGYKVGSAYEAEKIYPLDTVFVLCSVNWNDYINRYRGKGFRFIVSLRLLVRGNRADLHSLKWKNVLAMYGVDAIDKDKRKNELEELFQSLSDEDSRKTVEYVLKFRENGHDDNQFIAEKIATGDPDYFNRQFFPIHSKEVYLDIGPCDGGTILDFITRVNDRYKKICAWEIGQKSLEKLYKKFHDERIEILPYGAWNENVTMGIQGSGGKRQLSTMEASDIVCKQIDDVINYPVTMIKMDIEGAEMNALIGAQETIKKYKPKLIISIYHKSNDIWELPLFIHRLVPEYKLYIRHYRSNFNDTVLYAFI